MVKEAKNGPFAQKKLSQDSVLLVLCQSIIILAKLSGATELLLWIKQRVTLPHITSHHFVVENSVKETD